MKWFWKRETSVRKLCRLIPRLEGATVSRILVNVVDPEFNVVFIETNLGSFSIRGEVGGEFLGIREVDSMPEAFDEDGNFTRPYQPFERFVGRRIARIHQIGEIWNGHGFELSFERMPKHTMIVQSIYAGDKPDGFEDCLRLGIGNYQFEYKNT